MFFFIKFVTIGKTGAGIERIKRLFVKYPCLSVLYQFVQCPGGNACILILVFRIRPYLNPGDVVLLLKTLNVVFGIIPVLPLEFLLRFFHALATTVLLAGQVRFKGIPLQYPFLAFITSCTVIIMVVFVY